MVSSLPLEPLTQIRGIPGIRFLFGGADWYNVAPPQWCGFVGLYISPSNYSSLFAYHKPYSEIGVMCTNLADLAIERGPHIVWYINDTIITIV